MNIMFVSIQMSKEEWVTESQGMKPAYIQNTDSIIY
jgi:hypothetical protein